MSTPPDISNPPDRERLERSAAQAAARAARLRAAGNDRAAAAVEQTIAPALRAYRAMYGDEAADALRARMEAAAGADAAPRLEPASAPPSSDRRAARAALEMAAALIVAALLLWALLRSARGEQAPAGAADGGAAEAPAATKDKVGGKDKGGGKHKAERKCERGQTSAYDPETGQLRCLPPPCPAGQQVVEKPGGTHECGCPDGQAYNPKARACETLN